MPLHPPSTPPPYPLYPPPTHTQVVKVMSALQEGKIPQINPAELQKLIPAELLKSLPPPQEVIKTLTPLVETATKLAKSTDFSKVS